MNWLVLCRRMLLGNKSSIRILCSVLLEMRPGKILYLLENLCGFCNFNLINHEITNFIFLCDSAFMYILNGDKEGINPSNKRKSKRTFGYIFAFFKGSDFLTYVKEALPLFCRHNIFFSLVKIVNLIHMHMASMHILDVLGMSHMVLTTNFPVKLSKSYS